METVLIQLAASALIILMLGAYASSANAQHPAPTSEVEMLSISTFAEKNFRSFLNTSEDLKVDWFMKPSGKPPVKMGKGSPYGRVQQFLELRKLLAEKGHLSVKDITADSSSQQFITVAFAVAIFIAACAPLYCYYRNYTWEEDRNVKAFLIVHSAERGVSLLQEIFVATVLLLEAILVGHFLDGWIRICLLALIVSGFCFQLYKSARITIWQAKWKGFWTNVFLQGLSKASAMNDHDLYNRTFNVYQTVNTAPVLPLTGLQRLIVIVFGAAQLIVGLKLKMHLP